MLSCPICKNDLEPTSIDEICYNCNYSTDLKHNYESIDFEDYIICNDYINKKTIVWKNFADFQEQYTIDLIDWKYELDHVSTLAKKIIKNKIFL